MCYSFTLSFSHSFDSQNTDSLISEPTASTCVSKSDFPIPTFKFSPHGGLLTTFSASDFSLLGKNESSSFTLSCVFARSIFSVSNTHHAWSRRWTMFDPDRRGQTECQRRESNSNSDAVVNMKGVNLFWHDSAAGTDVAFWNRCGVDTQHIKVWRVSGWREGKEV